MIYQGGEICVIAVICAFLLDELATRQIDN